jgi:hypothetical protein
MTSKALALTAIGTQLILGLILVAILFSIQGQRPDPVMPWCQPGYQLNCRQPQPVTVTP